MNQPPHIIRAQRDLLRRQWEAESLRAASETRLREQREAEENKLRSETDSLRKRAQAYKILVDEAVKVAEEITALPVAILDGVSDMVEYGQEDALAFELSKINLQLASLQEASEALEQYRVRQKRNRQNLTNFALVAIPVFVFLAAVVVSKVRADISRARHAAALAAQSAESTQIAVEQSQVMATQSVQSTQIAVQQAQSMAQQVSLGSIQAVEHNSEWTPVIIETGGVQMVLVPPGCFEMGGKSAANERPRHRVCFEEPFWIDRYEVTNAQYGSAGNWEGAVLPRENVDWCSADAHCASRGARLPTEAEWEYAARGPDSLVYPWGNEFVADNTVYHANSGSRSWDVGTRPGGVSWVGAHDLTGNVWEWVNDWYHAAYYSTVEDGVVDPQGPEPTTNKVMRGGSFANQSERVLETINRSLGNPAVGSNDRGFRCALSYHD